MEPKKIHSALAAINSKVGAITKGRRNQQQGYNFRGIDDVYNELHELFAAEGVIILPRLVETQREDRPSKSGGVLIYSTCTYEFNFMATDGSRETITIQGEGMDSGDKSLNKAFSAALKYALMSMFLIPTEDAKDSEIESPEVKAAPKPAAKPAAKPAPTPVLKVMPQERFDKMMAIIKGAEPKVAADLIIKAREQFKFNDIQESILKDWEDNL